MAGKELEGLGRELVVACPLEGPVRHQCGKLFLSTIAETTRLSAILFGCRLDQSQPFSLKPRLAEVAAACINQCKSLAAAEHASLQ